MHYDTGTKMTRKGFVVYCLLTALISFIEYHYPQYQIFLDRLAMMVLFGFVVFSVGVAKNDKWD